MRTVKRNPFLSGVCAILGGLFVWVGAARADVASDRAAGIIIVPKVVFDSDGRFSPNDKPTDTEIQVSNVSNQQVFARCFYVDAVSHCSNSPTDACFTTSDCQVFGVGGICVSGWVETDFEISLTPHQPIVWRASQGIPSLSILTSANSGSIPRVGEDPFFGELKCVEVDSNGAPTDQNDLKGEATIVAADSSGIDARGYNAVGIEAVPGINDGDNTLVIGGPDPEYNGCPSVLDPRSLLRRCGRADQRRFGEDASHLGAVLGGLLGSKHLFHHRAVSRLQRVRAALLGQRPAQLLS